MAKTTKPVNVHDRFVHFDNCLERLQGARTTLHLVRENTGHPLVAPAFRFALVEYAVSFKASHGIDSARYVLSEHYVPVGLLELHKRVIKERDQLHAHGDLGPLEARVHVTNFDGQLLATTIQNQMNWLAELPNLPQLVSLIEGVIDNMILDRDSLKVGLPEKL